MGLETQDIKAEDGGLTQMATICEMKVTPSSYVLSKDLVNPAHRHDFSKISLGSLPFFLFFEIAVVKQEGNL